MKSQPIGVDDFKDIVNNNLYFIDKTLFIKEIIDDSSKVILITRPRRFGKTLNMSLLKYYFEKSQENASYMFENYNIWHENDKYKKEQGKYPVINLTFKDVKSRKWSTNYELIKRIIEVEFNRHAYLLHWDKASNIDSQSFERICYGKGNETDYLKSLETLSRMLCQYYQENAFIFLDEYDTFLNEAFINGHWEEAIEFMKGFMNAGFKNNLHLHKGIITGIFRVAKESIFSDMNNLNVSTILSDSYRQYFGFTEADVREILEYYNIQENMDKVAEWYNGYIFGEKIQTVIYNPWSIIMYVNKGTLKPYWINTSGNAIIRQLAIEGDNRIQLSIKDIMEDKVIEEVKIDDNIIYSEIANSDKNIWSFMLMSGYLKPVRMDLREDGVYCWLKAPNKEVFYFFRNMMEKWFNETIKGGSVEQMLKSLLIGDIKSFGKIFATTVEKSLSYYDVADDKSESFYHAFVLGLLVYIDKDYWIKSNRESGFGRYDVLIIPKNKNKKGLIIEFKKVDKYENETIDTALSAALKQIENKKYESELLDMGIKDIVKIGIAFKGKEVKIGDI